MSRLIARLEELVRSMDGTGALSLVPFVNAAYLRTANLACTADLLSQIKAKVRAAMPSKSLAEKLPVYTKIKEALAAYETVNDHAEKAKKLVETIVGTGGSTPTLSPAEQTAAISAVGILLASISNGCACVESVQKTIKQMAIDLAALTSAAAAAATTPGAPTLDAIVQATPSYASYGGRRRGGFAETASALASNDSHVQQLVTAVLAGDVKMVALLDAVDAKMTQSEKMGVANAYMEATATGRDFATLVERRLGAGVAAAAKDAGLFA